MYRHSKGVSKEHEGPEIGMQNNADNNL